MNERADFLVEIGTEELPPTALRRLEQAFAQAVHAGAHEAGLAPAGIDAFATPRRLAVRLNAVRRIQPPRKIEKRGPPVSVAFDAEGRPTRAAEAFAGGFGVPVDALERHETARGAWLIYRGEEPGQAADQLLPPIVNDALQRLPVPRRMRWGAGDIEFVRPVHWIVMLLDDQVLDAPLLGLRPGRTTRGHRFHAPGAIELPRPSAYESSLQEKGRVIAGFDARRERIKRFVDDAGQRLRGHPVVAPALLDEVTALVEWPVPVLGSFDAAFLELPEEVLIATLQDHQRYFPVRSAEGALLAHFIAISNLESREPDQVRLGNERVVRPRLADAAFFWQQDTQRRLDSRISELKRVVYQQKLGSLYDKAGRIAAIAAQLPLADGLDPKQLERAIWLARTDLVTAMVGEFPELQGCMAGHYARHDGEPAIVADALTEQYLPRHAGDALPATPAGRLLSLADRFDTLAGVFAIGKRPSGNKDPFGLRRNALGLLRILIECGIDVDVKRTFADALALQPVEEIDRAGLLDALYQFVIERLRAYYLDGMASGLDAGVVSHGMFEAVRLREPASPVDFDARVRAVVTFAGLEQAASLAAANKRIANILKQATDLPEQDADPARFTEEPERRLYDALDALLAEHRAALKRRDYVAVLNALATLREPVDAFFDTVMVMAEDPALRANRLALLRSLRRLFLDVADLSSLPAAAD